MRARFVRQVAPEACRQIGPPGAVLLGCAVVDDHRPGEPGPGDRLQYLDAIAILKHQIEGHAIEPGGPDFFDRLRA